MKFPHLLLTQAIAAMFEFKLTGATLQRTEKKEN